MELTPRSTSMNYQAMGGLPMFMGNAWEAMDKARQAAQDRGLKQAVAMSEIQKNRGVGGTGDFKLPQFEQDLNKRAFDQYGLKDMKTYMDAYRAIEKSAQGRSGADDMAMLYSFIKLLDPNSAVREGEYGAAGSTGSIWDMAKRMAAKAEMNPDKASPILSPTMRQAFLGSARNAMVSAAQSYRPREENFNKMVAGYQPWGVDPGRVYQSPFNQEAFSPDMWAQINSASPLGSYASKSFDDKRAFEKAQAEADEFARLEAKRRAAGIK